MEGKYKFTTNNCCIIDYTHFINWLTTTYKR